MPGFIGLDAAFLEHQGLAAWLTGPAAGPVALMDRWIPEPLEALVTPPDLVLALVDLVLGDRKEVQDGRAH